MIKFKGRERSLILRYIYLRKLEALDSKFVIVNSINAKLESQIEYESLSQEDKLNIYEHLMNEKIRNIIFDELYYGSLSVSEVNGSPEKRKMRIREIAYHKTRNMKDVEKKQYYEKLNYKYYEK